MILESLKHRKTIILSEPPVKVVLENLSKRPTLVLDQPLVRKLSLYPFSLGGMAVPTRLKRIPEEELRKFLAKAIAESPWAKGAASGIARKMREMGMSEEQVKVLEEKWAQMLGEAMARQIPLEF